MVVNEKCDVYSFGLVALETLMGKHPGDILSSLKSISTQGTKLSCLSSNSIKTLSKFICRSC
ncbi:putative protein kinase [Medicago truncatula]|uniref:non-specific serine/threonine protein kinase n=1 Tax=Medicago truncatula TaxID=3880 RepID=A0A396GUC1_MEDTR|nr:putative protein kinase [Medicago truncatula]